MKELLMLKPFFFFFLTGGVRKMLSIKAAITQPLLYSINTNNVKTYS